MNKMLKRVISLVLALIMVSGMLPMALLSASAADILYEVSFPRGSETQYPTNNRNYFWGNEKLTYLNGWGAIASRSKTGERNIATIFAINRYTNIGYCVEPSTLTSGDGSNPGTHTSTDNGSVNWTAIANGTGGTLNASQVESFLGLILYYGYHGNSNIPDWHSTDDKYNLIAQALATQLLVWEVVVGERDSNFNNRFDIGDPATNGYNRVKEHITEKHPLRSKIFNYYNDIAGNVKADIGKPSFCFNTKAEAEIKDNHYILEYDSGKFTVSLPDTGGTISKYKVSDFSVPEGVTCRISGNNLIVETSNPFSGTKTIKIVRKYKTPSASIYTDGKHQPGVGYQDIMTCNAQSLTPHTKEYYITVECKHHHVFIPHQVPATCTEQGYTLWKCACGMASTNDPWTGTDSYTAAQGHDKVNSPWVLSVPETCTADGVEVQLCSKCGDVLKTRAKAHTGHDSGVWKVDIEATPSRDGQKTRYCTLCGEALETTTFSYHTHKLGYTEIVRQPTCTENGLNGNFCSVCGACYETAEVEKSGHTSAEESVWVVTTTPTCTTPGEKTAYCANCGEKTATQQIERTEHTAGSWITNIYATCTSEGEEICVCDACGETINSRKIEPLGHDEGSWIVLNQATCAQNGEKALLCTRCGKTIDSEVLPATGHDDGVWKIDFEATPDHDGQKSRYCSKCDAVLESEPFSYHNHIEGYRKVILEPTCIDNGEEAIFCAICGVKYDTAAVSAPGHDWSEIAKNNDSTHSKTCSRCHYVYTESCTFTSGKTAATCVTPGYTTRTCTQCGYTYQDSSTASLGHKWTKWTDDRNGATHSRTCSRCNLTEKDVHVWTEWRIIEKSVIRRTTTYERKCEICGAIQQADKNFEIKHTLQKVEAKPNTCTEDGNSEYYYCTDVDCGKYFSDENAENEIEKDSWVIPAHDHDYHLRIDEKPTCTEDGYQKWICSWDASHNYEKVIPSHGHNYKLKETVPSTCTEDGYDYYECTWDASHNYTEPIPAHGHDYHLIEEKCVEPTADVPGYNYYECSYDASHNYRKTVYKIGDMSSNKQAQNNADGTTTITLSASSDAETVQVSKDKPVDVVLVLDTSGSMNESVNGITKINGLKQTANTFVESVAKNPENRIAVVSFATDGVFYKDDGEAYTLWKSTLKNGYGGYTYTDSKYDIDTTGAMMPVSENKETVKSIINGLNPNGATRADLAFKTAGQIITQNKTDARKTVVVFITDGQPGITGFSSDIANNAVEAAYENLKEDGVTVYSVGFKTDNDAKMTTFMNFVSSNYPEAKSMTSGGDKASDEYYIYASNADELNSMFETVVNTEIKPAKPFKDITIFDTISKEFTMTVLQEQAFRQSVINEYGVKNEDISVVSNPDGTTSITVKHLNPKTRNDANGNVIEYYVEISFDITANEKAAGAQYYNTNTESAGYMVGGMVVDSFASPRVTVPDDRNIVAFLLGGRVYTITEANIGDEIAVPSIGYAKWNVPEGYTVSQPYTEFEAEFTSTLRTVTWQLGGETVEESYHVGEPINIYPAEGSESGKFLGWSEPVPFAMPDRDLVFKAQYEDHTHSWSKEPVTQFGTCDEGITYVYACDCGETYTVKSEPCEHKLTATITNHNEVSYAIVTCENCGYVQEKYITYKAEYTQEDYNGNVNATNQTIDLTMYDANDVSVQPDGTISIVIPATSQMLHDSNLRIYRINEDGTTEDVTFTKDNDRDAIILNIDHFSYYVITASNEVEQGKTYGKVECGLTKGHDYVLTTENATCEADGCTKYVCSHCGDSYLNSTISATGHADNNGDGKCDECGTVTGKPCKHMCHSTKWYIKILWFIINLFNRLFRINQFCECGKAHW